MLSKAEQDFTSNPEDETISEGAKRVYIHKIRKKLAKFSTELDQLIASGLFEDEIAKIQDRLFEVPIPENQIIILANCGNASGSQTDLEGGKWSTKGVKVGGRWKHIYNLYEGAKDNLLAAQKGLDKQEADTTSLQYPWE